MTGFRLHIYSPLVVAFEKELNNNERKHVTNYFNSNSELIINDLNVGENLKFSFQTNM